MTQIQSGISKVSSAIKQVMSTAWSGTGSNTSSMWKQMQQTVNSTCTAMRLTDGSFDPAMADNGRLYAGFGPDFPSKMARLCDGADYILPNLTEAAFLAGEEPVLEGYSREWIERLAGKLHALGAKNVVLTGVSFERGLLGSAVSDGTKVEYDFNPRLDRMSHGTGDVYASVFAGAVLRGRSALDAAALAADVVCAAIKATDPGHWYGVSFEKTIPMLSAALSGGDAE